MNASMRSSRISRLLNTQSVCNACRKELRRAASTATAVAETDPVQELEYSETWDSPVPSEEQAKNFDPLKSTRLREKKKQALPPSRYQYRSPRYDRGPLAPHRPPPPTDPVSRQFVPGPFSQSRIESTYHSTIAADYMTLAYQHRPPGFRPPEKGERLRHWIGDNPYFKNRQLRGPRGGDVLRLLRKPITFRNIPMIERITLHTFVQQVVKEGSAPLHVAGMILQEITGQRIVNHKSRHDVQAFKLRAGVPIAHTVDLKGEAMYHFLDKLVNVVMPRIKDYRGVRATTGDNSGNLTFGFEPEVIGAFPEIENNYDAYPPKMIPGMHVTVHTTARADKDARLLLQAFGVPFYGRIVD